MNIKILLITVILIIREKPWTVNDIMLQYYFEVVDGWTVGDSAWKFNVIIKLLLMSFKQNSIVGLFIVERPVFVIIN